MQNLRRAAFLFAAILVAAPAAKGQQPVQGGDLTYRQRTEERLSALDREMRQLTGQIERLQFQLRQANQRIDGLEAELASVRAGQLPPDGAHGEAAPSQNPPATPEPGRNLPGAPDQGGGGSTLPTGAAQDSYDAAYGLLGQGKFDEGEAAFRAFLSRHPDSQLAPNARYWVAETLYARQRYQEAAEAFLEAWQADQQGAKAPDNLLKLGMSLQRLDKKREACASFDKLLSDYRGAAPRLRTAASREHAALGC